MKVGPISSALWRLRHAIMMAGSADSYAGVLEVHVAPLTYDQLKLELDHSNPYFKGGLNSDHIEFAGIVIRPRTKREVFA